MKVRANGIEIEVDDAGPRDGPAVLLIMGLGMQLIGWPQDFVQPLVDAGFRVIRHDNRDIGLSEGFDHAPRHNFLWQTVRSRLGLPVRSPYTLQDMANDSLGVLEIVTFIEKDLGVPLTDDELVPEHFTSIATIADLVSRRLDPEGAV